MRGMQSRPRRYDPGGPIRFGAPTKDTEGDLIAVSHITYNVIQSEKSESPGCEVPGLIQLCV